MAYASVDDVQARMTRTLTGEEETICESLLEDAGVIIDVFNDGADIEAKKVVSVRMVLRAVGDGDETAGFPMGATQGSMSALGYSQSFTVGGGGGVGELYLSKLEKQLLGMGNKIGIRSPLESKGCYCGNPNWWWSLD